MSSRSKRSPSSSSTVVPIRGARFRLAKAVEAEGEATERVTETVEAAAGATSAPTEPAGVSEGAEAGKEAKLIGKSAKPRGRQGRKAAGKASVANAEKESGEVQGSVPEGDELPEEELGPEIRVRRIHRRDINRTWEFLKLVFRDVNRETVEYQRPRSKNRFAEVYEDDEGEQLLFEIDKEIVGYAECSFEATGSDNWVNPRYFDNRGMRPLYVDELAVHPSYQGRGIGAFMLDQLQHLARLRGCTHLVLEVAENNKSALRWYRKRNFFRLDAAIFLAQKVPAEPDLLPPRRLPLQKRDAAGNSPTTVAKSKSARKRK